MNDSAPTRAPELLIEYLDKIAVINAAGDLRPCPADMLQDATKNVLEQGYRLVLFDFYDNKGIDDDGVVDYIMALRLLGSFDEWVESAIVYHRGTREHHASRLRDGDLYIMSRSFYEREDAIKELHERARRGRH